MSYIKQTEEELSQIDWSQTKIISRHTYVFRKNKQKDTGWTPEDPIAIEDQNYEVVHWCQQLTDPMKPWAQFTHELKRPVVAAYNTANQNGEHEDVQMMTAADSLKAYRKESRPFREGESCIAESE